jgi:predicted RNase H-like HicB family nuclease
MNFTIEMYQEEDGRHIADIPELPGCLVWDEIKEQAIRKAIVLALQIYADEIEHNEVEEEINLKAKNFSLNFVLKVPEPELVEA